MNFRSSELPHSDQNSTIRIVLIIADKDKLNPPYNMRKEINSLIGHVLNKILTIQIKYYY
jgi:hypothetical protein